LKLNSFIIFLKGNDDVAICKVNSTGQGTIEHYRNTEKNTPVYLSSTDKSVGFFNISVRIVDGQVICSFRRSKSMLNVPNYFDVKQTPSYYILSAYGTLSSNGK
jgi:hypothetical protein